MALIPAACLSVACGGAKRAQVAPPMSPFERQVRNAVYAGEGDPEVRLWRQKLAVDPNAPEPRLELARLYREKGYPDIALEHYRLAVERFPQSPEAVAGLAAALRDLGQKDEAVATLRTWLTSHPDAPASVHSWMGVILDDAERWGEGEAAHRAALKVDPAAAYLHNNLGYNLLKQGRTDDAAEAFREALKRDPASLYARNNLGLALAAKPGAGKQALGEWQAASDPATAHNNLAAAYIEQGKWDEARRELDQALGYNQMHPAALYNLRLVSEHAGQPAEYRPAGGRGTAKARSRWSRFGSGLKRAVIGPPYPAEGAAR